MSEGVLAFLIALSCWWFGRTRLLHNLRFFQQEEYQPQRFLQWVIKKRFLDKKGTLLALCAALVTYITSSELLCLTFALLFVIRTGFEEDPRSQGKLRLKMTERATSLYNTSLFLQAIGGIIALVLSHVYASFTVLWLIEAVIFQLTPLLVIGAHLINWPSEKSKQTLFEEEARAILAEINPYVIGITGSYGKTSTKEALGEIMQVSLGATFWPPKGINTVMGATREIRDRLEAGYQYAIMEMGAYGRGSIERLCDFTPPRAAIITAIGTAHLERFGSTENIYLTKAELAKAVPDDGILVCNGDDDGARKIALENPKQKTLLYGFSLEKGPLDCHISSFCTTIKGSEFTLEWKGRHFSAKTALHGKPALSNLAAAFTMACALGADPTIVIAAIANLQAVDNRLKFQQNGEIAYLHDAYNSNPIGFKEALDVMAALPFERKIVMTPGMIELGNIQELENESIGRKASQVCDRVLIVGNTNQSAFLKGLKNGGFTDEQIYICQSREEAFRKLNEIQQKGDLVLIENDLPDLYERIPCL